MKKEHVIEGSASVRLAYDLTKVIINAGTEDEQVILLTPNEIMDLQTALAKFIKLNL